VSSTGYIGTIEYDKVNSNLVYANRLFGNIIYRSINGGENWIQLSTSPGNPITDLAADPLNTGTVYATIGSFGINDQLFVSHDKGNSWYNISNDLPEVPCNSVAVCPFNNLELFVGTDIGVWKSQDGGNSWESFNEGLPAAVVVDDLHYYAPDTSVRIGTYGRGYWRIKTSSSVISSNKQTDVQPVQVYPNPSKDIFFLTESLGICQIFDITGQLILTVDNIKIDLSFLQPGIYYLKGENITLKLIKL